MTGKMVRLGDCVEIVMGQAPPGDACNKDGEGTIFVKAGEFQERSPVIREWTTRPLKFATVNDTLVCVVGATAGKVNLSTFACAIGRSVAAVRPLAEKLDPLFLFQFLKTTVGLLRDRAQGAAQGVITREMLQSLKLILPRLQEQRRVAAILDQADALRVKRREALALVDELQRGLFIETFGDPVVNPRSWAMRPLEAVCKKITDGTHKTPVYVDEGIEFLSAKDLKNGRVQWGSGKFVSNREHAELIRRCNPELGDLLLAKSGSLGAVALIDRCHEFSLFESLCLIKHDRKMIDGTYLACLLRVPSMQAHLLGKNKGIAIKHLHLVDVRALDIPIPPMALQKQFADHVATLERQANLYSEGLSAMGCLFSSIQHRAFQGEL